MVLAGLALNERALGSRRSEGSWRRLEPRQVEAQTVQKSPPYVPTRGIQVFAAGETSFADDRTSWAGAMLGVCIQVGRVCVSARGRIAMLIAGPGIWDDAERRATDVLFGGDIPFGFGRMTLSVGFGAGMGTVHTVSRASGMTDGSATDGLRADAHLGWTIRLARRFSIDLSAAVDVAQVTDVEGSSSRSVVDEPRIFGRLGAGLRIGAGP